MNLFYSLHDNATYGRINLLKGNLYVGRADVNGKYTELQTTALHAAAYNGHLNVVKYLIEVWKADTTIVSADGWNVCHMAAINGYLPVLKYLLEDCQLRSGVESNDGWTCLHAAAAHGFLPVVKYLVEKQKMDVDFTTYSGWTALHWACCNGYTTVVRYLLESAGANINVKTDCGYTFLHVAAHAGQKDVVSYLLSLAGNPVAVKSTTVDVQDSQTQAAADDKSEVSSTANSSPSSSSSSHEPAAASAVPDTKPSPFPLPELFLLAVTDGSLDAFSLACRHGKLAVALLLVDRIGRTSESFTMKKLQIAHDLHRTYCKKRSLVLNHELIKYLRSWMQELQYGDVSECEIDEEEDADEAEEDEATDSEADAAENIWNGESAAPREKTSTTKRISSEMGNELDVEVLSIRELLKQDDARRQKQFNGLSPTKEADEDEQEDEDEDGNEDEDDEDDEDDEFCEPGPILPRPTKLDNAHLARSPTADSPSNSAGSSSIPAAAP